jgi:hypothetical protein
MDTAKTSKTSLRNTDPFQIGQEDLAGVTHDDPLHVALAVHQHSDLTVDLAGDLGQGSGKLLGDQGSGWDASLIKLLETLALERL